MRTGLILAILCGLAFAAEACNRSANLSNVVDCDSTCEAQVRVQSMGAGLKMTDAQWHAAFASAMDSLAHDPEWVELNAEMKEVICQPHSQKFRDWNERESKKNAEDMSKDNPGKALMPGDSPEVNRARAEVVKIKILMYVFLHGRQSCNAQ
jgi:hypothetical protein